MKNIFRFLTSIMIIFFVTHSHLLAQTVFERTYDKGQNDYGTSVQQTSDGGYIISMHTQRLAGLIKTNSFGDTLWTRRYGDPLYSSSANSVLQTSDGGYILGGEFSNRAGILKTNSLGDTLWTRKYEIGIDDNLGVFSVRQTSDGGYIIVGTDVNRIYSAFLIKTNSLGDMLWKREFRDFTNGYFTAGYSGQETSDGGYIVAGNFHVIETYSTLGYLVKTNSLGDTLWTRKYDVDDYHNWDEYLSFHYVQQTSDGGYILGGEFSNRAGILKTNSLGDTLWTRRYGDPLYISSASSVRQTSDGGYIIVGKTLVPYNDAQKEGDVYLIKTNSLGDTLWTRKFGSDTTFERGISVQQTSDGGYIIAGYTESVDGNSDVYLIKTNKYGGLVDLTSSISGILFNDLNRNGTKDSNEVGIPDWKISLSGTMSRSVLTDKDGNYSFEVPAGSYTVTEENRFGWGRSIPVSGSYTLSLSDSVTITGKDFGNFIYNGSISGNVFHDKNGNGIPDSGIIGGLKGRIIKLLPVGYYATSDTNGDYSFNNLPSGTYTVSLLGKKNWEQTYPSAQANHQITLSADQQIDTADFGSRNYLDMQDISVSLSGGPARPGFYTGYGIMITNNGPVYTSTLVTFFWPLYGDRSEWMEDSIPPGHSRNIYASVRIPAPDTVNCDDKLKSHVIATVLGDDANPGDNIACFTQTVTCSMDPNDKLVDPVGIGGNHLTPLDTSLVYTIRFQNTGNDTAFNIVIKDTLDQNLDMSTVTPGAGSHPYSFEVTGERELKWTLANVNLPDSNVNQSGSNGFVSFSVRPLPSAENNIVKNTASIFFDFNLPVQTNSVENLFYIKGVLWLNGGWNMISLPVDVPDKRKNTIYPEAISTLFYYDEVYKESDSLNCGKGYWLKFPTTAIHTFDGDPIDMDTIDVVAGWNMIGSISIPVAVSSIGSIPPDLVTSNFFEYGSTYLITDIIYPGRGYWVKVDTVGKLILSANTSTNVLAKNRIKIVSTSEMPPPSPDENTSTVDVIPRDYALDQAYPNPFNPTTTLKYALPSESRVKLTIYNVLGQVVDVLMDAVEDAGYRSAEWNASLIASGIYFYKLEATSVSDPSKSFTQVKKMILVK